MDFRSITDYWQRTMHNKKLAIAIPTYNRHEILHEDLTLILPELIQHSIAVYISDDSNNDNTQEMVSELTKLHPYIYYVKNNPSLGHDKNILSTLQLPDTDYVWLLGDSVIIKNGKISKILEILNTEVDFVFVNSYVKNADNNIIITNINDFLIKYTWYLTLTGATIYSSNVIKTFNSKANIKYYRNFQQLAIILDQASSAKTVGYWIGEDIISCNKNKESYWLVNAIEVFVNDWSLLVNSFPNVFICEDTIEEVILSHTKNTGIFSLLNLIRYRSVGAINFSKIFKNYHLLKVAVKNRMYLFFIISMLPKSSLWVIVKLVKAGRQQMRKSRR